MVQSLVYDTESNKTKALVVSRSWTVSPPYGDLVLPGVSIRASPNLDILSVKFEIRLTLKDHLLGIVSRVSQGIGILRLVKRIFLVTSVLLLCYLAFVLPFLKYCSLVWGSAAECPLQLLERQVYLVAWLCPDPRFLSLCQRHRINGLSMWYKVNSDSNHCLFCELPSASTRVRHTRAAVEVHPLEFEVARCRTSQFARPFLTTQVRMWNFPALCFTLDRWMGSRVQSTFGCTPELCFLQFSVAQLLVGLRKQYMNNFVFPKCAVAVGFNNNKVTAMDIDAQLCYTAGSALYDLEVSKQFFITNYH